MKGINSEEVGMNDTDKDFCCFMLPGGTIYPCPAKDGKPDFPWGKAMEFISTAREVFSSRQIDNAAGYLRCDEIIRKLEAGEKSLDFMHEIASYVEFLRKRWRMDG